MFVTASPGDEGSTIHLQAIIPMGAACLLVLFIVVFLLRHSIGRIVCHQSPNGAAEGKHLMLFRFVCLKLSPYLIIFHCRSSKTQRIYILGIGIRYLLLL